MEQSRRCLSIHFTERVPQSVVPREKQSNSNNMARETRESMEEMQLIYSLSLSLTALQADSSQQPYLRMINSAEFVAIEHEVV